MNSAMLWEYEETLRKICTTIAISFSLIWRVLAHLCDLLGVREQAVPQQGGRAVQLAHELIEVPQRHGGVEAETVATGGDTSGEELGEVSALSEAWGGWHSRQRETCRLDAMVTN